MTIRETMKKAVAGVDLVSHRGIRKKYGALTAIGADANGFQYRCYVHLPIDGPNPNLQSWSDDTKTFFTVVREDAGPAGEVALQYQSNEGFFKNIDATARRLVRVAIESDWLANTE